MTKKNYKELTELQMFSLRKKVAAEVAKDKRIRKMVVSAIKDGAYDGDPTYILEYIDVPKKYEKYFEGGGLPDPDDFPSYEEQARQWSLKEKAIEKDPTIEILCDEDGCYALMDAVLAYALKG